MESAPGTYALILHSRSKREIQVGCYGRLTLRPGYYTYIGSALGPGGVRARVSRHCRRTKRKHWHIDYLRVFVSLVSVWYIHSKMRLEHKWARTFEQVLAMVYAPGFGCSDCRCRSHLFWSASMPNRTLFSKHVRYDIKTTQAIRTLNQTSRRRN